MPMKENPTEKPKQTQEIKSKVTGLSEDYIGEVAGVRQVLSFLANPESILFDKALNRLHELRTELNGRILRTYAERYPRDRWSDTPDESNGYLQAFDGIIREYNDRLNELLGPLFTKDAENLSEQDLQQFQQAVVLLDGFRKRMENFMQTGSAT